MTRKRSIGWRLVFTSWSFTLIIVVLLAVVFYIRTERHLVSQVESTLEAKCDEVIAILEGGGPLPMLREFLLIETRYRFSPFTYYYRILAEDGSTLARSETLGNATLPLPEEWRQTATGYPMSLSTEPDPSAPRKARVRVRSERVPISVGGGEPREILIQTAASLAPVEAMMRSYLVRCGLVISIGLAAVFLLLGFVTTRSLHPVSAMTRQASQITATNVQERLPISGSGNELDELALVLNSMLDGLQRSLHQMEQFSADAAHQLKTPLTRIRGELDLVVKDELSAPVRSSLEQIQEELDHLNRLCSRLLLLAQLDQGATDRKLLSNRIYLDQLLRDLLDQMNPTALERGVNLRSRQMQDVTILGSHALLVEAVLNLLHNAVRFTPRGGTIEVSLERRNGLAFVTVEDDGPGIPTEERGRIFYRFHKVRRSGDAAENGDGLGLAIVRGIANVHGGRVEVDDGVDGGSAFRLVLPVAEDS